MQLEQIQALLQAFDNSQAVSLVWQEGEQKLSLKKAEAFVQPVAAMPAAAPIAAPAPVTPAVPAAPAPVAAETQPASQPTGETINAPLVGTFYAASAPGKPVFAAVGDTVKQGQTVCLIEAMKMMSEVPAPFDCVIEEVLIADGELAAFGAPLFRVTRL